MAKNIKLVSETLKPKFEKECNLLLMDGCQLVIGSFNTTMSVYCGSLVSNYSCLLIKDVI